MSTCPLHCHEAEQNNRHDARPAEPNVEEAREAFQNVLKDGSRAAEVVDSVRAMFKKGQTVKTQLNLNDLITSVLYLLRHELQPQHIVLRTNLDSRPLVTRRGCPLCVPVSSQRVPRQGIAVGNFSRVETVQEPTLALRRSAVGEGIRDYIALRFPLQPIVADG